jgi:enterochelin esterase-like enzyme/endonuclease/exonuclease/phosphatase family metal-dependent hydrolase
MKYFLLALLHLGLLLLGPLANSGELKQQSFHSQILNKEYRYLVYLPDDYARLDRQFPVLYLLHGAGGDEHEWWKEGGVKDTIDGLVRRGDIQPMVVVMPGQPQAWWIDATGAKAESALLKELMPHAESNFRVQQNPPQRLIAGASAGGYGALNLVLKHPQAFVAAALLSPAIYDPNPPEHSAAQTQPPFQTAGRFDQQKWRAQHYTQFLETYKQSAAIVPLFIEAGDRDKLGIALQSAMLFEKLRLHQPDAIALNVHDGGHDWGFWRASFPRALAFLNARLRPALQPQSIRVMSYNIRCGSCESESDVNHWSRRKFLVADVIRRSRADVIGLQEAELFQARSLAALLGDFAWVGVGRDDGAEKGEMNTVFVRRSAFSINSYKTLWLSETPEQVSIGWDAALNRTVTVVSLKSKTTGQDLNFLNTHFDHVGARARKESAVLISRVITGLGDKSPKILAGDLNAVPNFPGYESLTHQMRDAATVTLTQATGGDMTFNGFGFDLQRGNKIDYLFVSPGPEVKSHKVITDLYDGLYPSDHFPVLIDVTLPGLR